MLSTVGTSESGERDGCDARERFAQQQRSEQRRRGQHERENDGRGVAGVETAEGKRPCTVGRSAKQSPAANVTQSKASPSAVAIFGRYQSSASEIVASAAVAAGKAKGSHQLDLR